MNGHVHDHLVSAEPPSLGLHNIEFSSAAEPLQPNRFSRLKHPAINETPGDCCNDLLSRSLCFLQYALRFLQLFQVLTLEDIGGAMVV